MVRLGKRLSREEFFYGVAELCAKRSTCARGHVGCCATSPDGRIVATGYNGSPPGAPHCLDVGCDVPADAEEMGCQRAIHAEANLVAWAARVGVSLHHTTVYSTHSPCAKCAQLLVQAGIERFCFISEYRLERLDILWSANIYISKRGEYENRRMTTSVRPF